MKLIYLANPYTGSENVMEKRYEDAVGACAYLIANRFNVYSPIVHCHPIAKRYAGQEIGEQADSKFWMERNQWAIDKSDAICVLCIDGWLESPGVQFEIQQFKLAKKDGCWLGPELGTLHWGYPI